VTALAALLTVLLAYRVVINEPGPNQYIDVKIGAWLGLLSSALIAYGGYRSMRDEGTSLGDAREQARAAGQQARAAFETTAPRDEEGGSTPPPSAGPPPPPSAPPAAAPAAPPAAAPEAPVVPPEPPELPESPMSSLDEPEPPASQPPPSAGTP
jgi:hypothetical protein